VHMRRGRTKHYPGRPGEDEGESYGYADLDGDDNVENGYDDLEDEEREWARGTRERLGMERGTGHRPSLDNDNAVHVDGGVDTGASEDTGVDRDGPSYFAGYQHSPAAGPLSPRRDYTKTVRAAEGWAPL